MGFGKVKIDDVRGGGTLNTRNIEGFGNKTSKSDGGITRGILLIIGRFMRFIDHNKAKISEWGKKGGAGPITTNGFGPWELVSASNLSQVLRRSTRFG